MRWFGLSGWIGLAMGQLQANLNLTWSSSLSQLAERKPYAFTFTIAERGGRLTSHGSWSVRRSGDRWFQLWRRHLLQQQRRSPDPVSLSKIESLFSFIDRRDENMQLLKPKCAHNPSIDLCIIPRSTELEKPVMMATPQLALFSKNWWPVMVPLV